MALYKSGGGGIKTFIKPREIYQLPKVHGRVGGIVSLSGHKYDFTVAPVTITIDEMSGASGEYNSGPTPIIINVSDINAFTFSLDRANSGNYIRYTLIKSSMHTVNNREYYDTSELFTAYEGDTINVSGYNFARISGIYGYISYSSYPSGTITLTKL